MIDSVIDRVRICRLPSRYGIARSALYTRMQALGIKPEKEGKQASISLDQLHQLDALHDHLQSGGTTAEFLAKILGTPQAQESSIEFSSEPLIYLLKELISSVAKTEPETRLLLSAISHLFLAKAQYFEPDINPFRTHLLLNEAANSGCVLSNSELLAILKIERIPSLKQGKFARKGFLFSRVERNAEIPTTSGREAEWRVSRSSSPAS